jgi:hypothetical protein
MVTAIDELKRSRKEAVMKNAQRTSVKTPQIQNVEPAG